MSHKITAAADILLMPSRFEPCGLNQLYAMAYGTVPVAHATGGLRDTVIPFNPYEGQSEAPATGGMLPWTATLHTASLALHVIGYPACGHSYLPELWQYTSVVACDAGTGTGWTFSPCTTEAFVHAIRNAVETYREHPDSFRQLQHRGMERNYSWDKAAAEYEQIFEWAKIDQPYCK